MAIHNSLEGVYTRRKQGRARGHGGKLRFQVLDCFVKRREMRAMLFERGGENGAIMTAGGLLVCRISSTSAESIKARSSA